MGTREWLHWYGGYSTTPVNQPLTSTNIQQPCEHSLRTHREGFTSGCTYLVPKVHQLKRLLRLRSAHQSSRATASVWSYPVSNRTMHPVGSRRTRRYRCPARQQPKRPAPRQYICSGSKLWMMKHVSRRFVYVRTRSDNRPVHLLIVKRIG